MASSGRRPPGDLRNTLGSLVQSALEQVGAVREVVGRSAQAQRSRYDSVRHERRRRDALAALGEVVHALATRGQLGDLVDDPEVRAQLEEIAGIDQRAEASEQRDHGSFAANAGTAPGARARPKRERGSDGEVRVWRPVRPSAVASADPECDDEPAAIEAEREHDPPPMKGRGISFGDDWDDDNDDDDLEEYMCDDDIPAATEPEPPPPKAKAKAKAKPKAKPRKRRTAKAEKKSI